MLEDGEQRNFPLSASLQASAIASKATNPNKSAGKREQTDAKALRNYAISLAPLFKVANRQMEHLMGVDPSNNW